MTERIVIDPMTRIEGHLRIEVDVDNGKVSNARVSGTMARGLESLLKGRDPRDATYVTERVCGVCFSAHGWTSSMAVEMAQGTTALPEAARLVRNLVVSAAWLHDHVLHFYLLALPDFLDMLKIADYQGDDSTIQKLRDLIAAELKNKPMDGRYAAPFLPSYLKDEHCVTDLDTVVTLMQHYFAAIKIQRQAKKMSAMLGGKQPHQSAIVAGGVTNLPGSGALSNFSTLLEDQAEFIENTYIKDVLDLTKGSLKNLAMSEVGVGYQNYLCYGGFPEQGGDFVYPAGAIVNEELIATSRAEIEPAISEDVVCSWYIADSGGHPKQSGEAFDLEKPDAYSFIKAARFNGQSMEVGPLARMIIAAKRSDHPAYNHQSVQELKNLIAEGFRPGVVLRHAARALEMRLLIEAMRRWVIELKDLIPSGPIPISSTKIHDSAHWAPPATGDGCGMSEAPRGSLGHWIQVSGSKVSHYACVTPTTWNASQTDSSGLTGPIEEALKNCPVPDLDNPISIARIVRSFDPCIACAVHVMSPGGRMRRFAIDV